MFHDWQEEVIVLICKTARSTEHLDDANHAKHEEHHPDDLVTLKQIAYLMVHVYSVFINSVAYNALTKLLNCSPLSSMFLNRSKLAQHGLKSTVSPVFAIS